MKLRVARSRQTSSGRVQSGEIHSGAAEWFFKVSKRKHDALSVFEASPHQRRLCHIDAAAIMKKN